ncbi:MAG: TIGR02147 family protein [Bacteriovorax sp.]|nr:TIGR02147 family protein [Bacteriovorax sp.]
MEKIETSHTLTPTEQTLPQAAIGMNERPAIYDYVDYRAFLSDSLNYIQSRNSKYSATAFVRQAGFGENSRGYFNLIMSGKRNLSSSTILGFAKTIKLNEKETFHFENLVHYNQATTEKEKALYFERISKSMKGRTGAAFELLKSQYNYFSHWYLVAIRELVAVENFKENYEWVSKKLRNKISKKEMHEAIADLINLGLLKRQDNGKLLQAEEFVTFTDNSMNYTVVNALHSQFLDLAKESLSEDQYKDRSASCVVIATEKENFDKIREEIKAFREHILNKYGTNSGKLDCVLNLGIQLNHITALEQ